MPSYYTEYMGNQKAPEKEHDVLGTVTVRSAAKEAYGDFQLEEPVRGGFLIMTVGPICALARDKSYDAYLVMHEASHALAAELLGAKVTAISLRGKVYPLTELSKESLTGIENYVKETDLAGGVWYGNINHTQHILSLIAPYVAVPFLSGYLFKKWQTDANNGAGVLKQAASLSPALMLSVRSLLPALVVPHPLARYPEGSDLYTAALGSLFTKIGGLSPEMTATLYAATMGVMGAYAGYKAYNYPFREKAGKLASKAKGYAESAHESLQGMYAGAKESVSEFLASEA